MADTEDYQKWAVRDLIRGMTPEEVEQLMNTIKMINDATAVWTE